MTIQEYLERLVKNYNEGQELRRFSKDAVELCGNGGGIQVYTGVEKLAYAVKVPIEKMKYSDGYTRNYFIYKGIEIFELQEGFCEEYVGKGKEVDGDVFNRESD